MTHPCIWLATDLAEGAEQPWIHALRLAVAMKAELRVLHASVRAGDHDWKALTPAEDLLERWRLFEGSDATPMQVPVQFKGLTGRPREVLPLVMRLEEAELLVVGTHRPSGLRRAISGSMGETLARAFGPGRVLLVPQGVDGIVDPVTGAPRLHRVLVPVGEGAEQQHAIDAAADFARTLSVASVEFLVLHRGSPDSLPALDYPEQPGWAWRTNFEAEGPPVSLILSTAIREAVSLIVMLTRGHDSLGDGLFGSQTERVVREAVTPVLVVRP